MEKVHTHTYASRCMNAHTQKSLYAIHFCAFNEPKWKIVRTGEMKNTLDEKKKQQNRNNV